MQLRIIALPTLKCKSAGPLIMALESGEVSAIKSIFFVVYFNAINQEAAAALI